MKSPDVTRKSGFNLADLQKIFTLVRKNWWIVVILVGISFGIGSIYVYKLEKVYASGTQLLLKSNDEFTSGSLIADNSGGFYGNTYKTFIDNSNEIRVLKSQDLIEATLRRLDFDVSYFIVGRLKTEEVYSGVPFSIRPVFLNPGLYEQMISFRIIYAEEFDLE